MMYDMQNNIGSFSTNQLSMSAKTNIVQLFDVEFSFIVGDR